MSIGDEPKLNWFNLRINKCPMCGKDWALSLVRSGEEEDTLLTHSCGFRIREKRYKEIVSDQVNKSVKEYGND